MASQNFQIKLLTMSLMEKCRFLDPIILGKYPKEMHDILGPDLLPFSKYDLEKLKSGLDFVGINHYTSYYVKDCIFSTCEQGKGSSKTEGFALTSPQMNGLNIGEPVLNFIPLINLILCHKTTSSTLVNH